MPRAPDEHDRTEELRELARYARQRHDLYRARAYGPRATSASRLRELERESVQAQARLDAYLADRCEALDTAPGSNDPG